MNNFKKGDLVVPSGHYTFDGNAPVGLIIEVGKQPDGKTHHILWVDSEGSFESWHYENAIIHYKKEEQQSEEEA